MDDGNSCTAGVIASHRRVPPVSPSRLLKNTFQKLDSGAS
jgi:hypothetical protein